MQSSSSSAQSLRPLIPLADYQRIFRVIHSVLHSVEADIPAASFFFSVTAAQILKKFYKRNAFPVAGAAFYLISQDGGGALSFGTLADDGHTVASNHDAFHAWVQCDGYAIDFMAPLFQELLVSAGHPLPVPRQMFQKDLQRMSESVQTLAQPGDFHLLPNLELTRELLQQFMAKKALTNLSQLCLEWFRKPPKAMPADLALQGADGEISRIQLQATRIDGVW
ncbi:DUF2026 family protein [Herbaspirillum sp. AP02]|uniref:DUF2026 family protein n=1 Tax=unclassified Herbaspirillum TaxID=2624150 RepID=UPI0015D9B319|nr:MULTISPECIES: DUF2026 family protein [unclassified Herbaspirillum]MBG7620478.1 DUF2026 family protein [Herbaspirillum sp. AP02]NZD67942.1 DUF2026 family protein [Herbaspirillum sp. AP21]